MIITLLCGHDHLWWIIAMSVRILQSAPVSDICRAAACVMWDIWRDWAPTTCRQ